MRIITNNNQIYILDEYVCITQLHELYTVYYMHKYTLYVHIIYITLHNYIYIYITYFGTTGGLFVCGPKPMLEAISNVLETICFYLGNYITNFGNYIWKFVP